MAERVPMPAAVSSLRLLDRIDYEDAHVAETDQILTPEAWGRLIFAVAPQSMLRFGRLVHRFALGLEIGASSPERPMGWNRLDADAGGYVLSANGQRTRVRLVGFTTDTTVGLATQMTFDSEIGRLIWAPIAPIHRAFARDFLDRAVAEAAR